MRTSLTDVKSVQQFLNRTNIANILDNSDQAFEFLQECGVKSAARSEEGKNKYKKGLARWPAACKKARARMKREGKPVPAIPGGGTLYNKFAREYMGPPHPQIC